MDLGCKQSFKKQSVEKQPHVRTPCLWPWTCLQVLEQAQSGLLTSYSAFLQITMKLGFPVARTIALCGRERALVWDFTWMTSRAAPLPCAPPYRRDGCANWRKVTRSGRLEHFLNLSLSKPNLRGKKTVVRSAKTRAKRQAVFLLGVEEVSQVVGNWNA